MITQERIERQVSSQQLVTPLPETFQNNNWLYSGTEEAWLKVDYSLPPYQIINN